MKPKKKSMHEDKFTCKVRLFLSHCDHVYSMSWCEYINQ